MTAAGPPDGTRDAPAVHPGAAATSESTSASAAAAATWGADEPTYAVKLPVFEGPLDLLLHLIRTNEVDITDIPIATVAEQYLAYVELMRELQLDIAGEYLLMAATLAWIKSRMLLPPDPAAIQDESVDPRAELVARLLEYQRFKEVAGEMGERQLLGRDVFPAQAPGPEPEPEAEREIEVGIFQLMEAMKRVLDKASHTGAAHEVEAETVTVHERMLAVMDSLRHRDACEFEELVIENGVLAGRPIIVTTFLAILELTRLEAIGLYQGIDERGVPRGTIHVKRKQHPDDREWVERVSDLM
ncbi:MAG: segregation/condensation protein A [Myxococcota bacterium]